MKRVLLAVIGVLLFLLVCVGAVYMLRSSSVPSTGAPAAAPVTPSSDVYADSTALQDLVFSGAVTGHMVSGRPGQDFICTPPAVGPIVGSVNGAPYIFSYRAPGAAGPGTYLAYVQIGPLATTEGYYGADNATLVIGNDSRSGTIDAELRNSANPKVLARVTGTWRCPG